MKPNQMKGTLKAGKRVVKFLKAFYYAGGKWYRVGAILGGVK